MIATDLVQLVNVDMSSRTRNVFEYSFRNIFCKYRFFNVVVRSLKNSEHYCNNSVTINYLRCGNFYINILFYYYSNATQ